MRQQQNFEFERLKFGRIPKGITKCVEMVINNLIISNVLRLNAVSGNAVSGNAVSGNAVSGNAVLGNAVSGNAVVADNSEHNASCCGRGLSNTGASSFQFLVPGSNPGININTH
jgi:hypothetical protein